nr:MAG TPA: tail assembly chaperone protein [Bacteriophage sp.]
MTTQKIQNRLIIRIKQTRGGFRTAPFLLRVGGKENIMTITMNGKEYNIKFGNKAVARAGFVSKLARIGAMQSDPEDSAGALEGAEKMYLLMPQILLAGLQANHSDEFGYNLTTGKDHDKQLSKVEDMLDHFVDEENGDFLKLQEDVTNEILHNGFLKKLFEEETAKAQDQIQK